MLLNVCLEHCDYQKGSGFSGLLRENDRGARIKLVDMDIDLTIITAHQTEESVHLAKRIEEFSAKYAIGGQMGLIINKVQNNNMEELYALLKKYDLDILGTVPYDENIENITRNSDKVVEAVKSFFYRLNLPQ